MLMISERYIGIYCVTNTKNNKKYIGKTSENFSEKWKEIKRELNSGKRKNKHLQNSWNKYGENCFKFEIVETIQPISNEDTTNLVVNHFIKMFINEFDTKNPDKGFNN